MTQLPLSVDQVYSASVVAPPPDGASPLLDLAEALERNQLIAPPHQRSRDAWSVKKRQLWIDRNRAVVSGIKQRPLGTICIYLLSDEGNQCRYLNEGLQRISACLDALTFPKKYGFHNRDEAERVLRGSYIHVQYRHYKNHREAAGDFEEVNNGTGLDKSERYKHVLLYADEWNYAWDIQFKKWSDSLNESLSSFTKTSKIRTNGLIRERSTRHLFAVAHIGRPLQGNDNTPEVETSCVDVARQCVPENVDSNIRRMYSFVAEIESAWRSVYSEPAKMMNNRLARWCIGVMFVNQDDVPVNFWNTFLVKLFASVKSKVNLVDSDGNNFFLTSNLGLFRPTCRVLGVDIPERPRRKSNGTLKTGWHDDHVLPLVDSGDGPTEPLPARLNAAKCARAIKS